jgi:hypothetical protein
VNFAVLIAAIPIRVSKRLFPRWANAAAALLILFGAAVFEGIFGESTSERRVFSYYRVYSGVDGSLCHMEPVYGDP